MKNLSLQSVFAGIVSVLWIAGIILSIMATTSCSTKYNSGIGHKVAPLVNNYDKKEIKLQTSSNVQP